MTPAIRHKKILEALQKSGALSVNELADLLYCSGNTIRNDIRKLADLGKLVKVHGGAATFETLDVYREDPFDIRLNQNIKQKNIIAEIAAQHIIEQKIASVFMDSSTTCLVLAKKLIDCPHKLTIITNFYDIAVALSSSKNVAVSLLGGYWWGNEHCTIGEETCTDLKKYRAQIAVISCKGFITHQGNLDGVYDINMETAVLKKIMCMRSTENWLLVDSSKINASSHNFVFNFSPISYIISDMPFSEDTKIYFTNLGIKQLTLK